MTQENHTAKHMEAWFKKKAEMKRFKDLPDKKGQALGKKYAEAEKARLEKKANNPLNKPCVKEGVLKAIGDAITSQLGHNTLGRPIPMVWKQGIDAFQKEMKKSKEKKRKNIKEDVPTNSMGLSSSTQGPVQTYDPLLGDKDRRKKRIKDMWRRMLGRK